MPTSRADIDAATPLGATLRPDGVAFRVWAPAAREVFVLTGPDLTRAGESGFAPSGDAALFPLADGTWGAFVEGLRENAAYRFWVDGIGSSGLKRDPRARELSTAPAYPECDCYVRPAHGYPWHDRDFRCPDFRDLIQYQLHVGVYYAVDDAGADKRGRVGRFLDLLDRVDHLRDLGVNAVQLLPIQEFASPTSRGYNGVDLFSPEMDYQVPDSELPRYVATANRLLAARGYSPVSIDHLRAGPNQLKCVIDVFHAHGIAVLFDLVFNHAGPGFNPQSLWFLDRQVEGDDNRSLYFTDHEWVGGRIFAYWKDEVRQFLIDNALQCLDEFHVDGIRYDEVTVIAYNGGERFCQDVTNTVRFVKPQAIQIAEYWADDRAEAMRAPPGGLGFDAAWHDRIRDGVRSALAQASGGRDAFVDMEALARAFDVPAGFHDAWRAVNFLEDHDTVYHDRSRRIASLADPSNPRSWHARSRARVALGLLMAARGIPMLFMGQEILEDKQWNDDVGFHSSLLIWWDGLKTDAVMRDYLAFCRDLIWLRRDQPALRSEALRVTRRSNLERVITIHRWIEGVGGDVLFVANLQEENRFFYRVGFPGAGHWREIFNSDAYDGWPNPHCVGNGGGIVADETDWDGLPASCEITLPANGFVVFAR